MKRNTFKNTSLGKIICVLILIANVILFASCGSAKEETADYWFNVDNEAQTATVKTYFGFDSNITVPSKYKNMPVVGIGDTAYQKTDIKSINFTSLIKSIGNSVFFECKKLDNVVIPDTVEEMGSYVFYKCSSLSNVQLPSTLDSIKAGTFEECTSLQSFTIGNNIKHLELRCFANCTNLTYVYIPASITTIEADVFIGDTKLVEITYAGTEEQFNAISKVKDWDKNSKIKTIHCSDKDINLV